MLFGAGDLLIPNRFLHTGQTTADVAALARTSMPHATVEVVPHAGHLLMIERPDVFTRRVRTFLRA
jgi:pimeloyl-ACP methyl ester carboxylesterase